MNSPLRIPEGSYPPGSLVSLKSSRVQVDSFLAEGGYAHVYKVTVIESALYSPTSCLPGSLAVLKRVACADEGTFKDLEREIDHHKTLSVHPNIVSFYDFSLSKLRNGGFEVLILMELCHGGPLMTLMNKAPEGRLEEDTILQIFLDVCQAVNHMHTQNPPILHRDIKIENVLLADEKSWLFKLCDFGSCTTQKLPPGAVQPIQDIRALELEVSRHTTLQYRPPELCDLYSKREVSEKVDIWALGVFLFKLCYYTTPFEESGKLAIMNAKFTIPPIPTYSLGLQSLIRSLIQIEPEVRPDIATVVFRTRQLQSKEGGSLVSAGLSPSLNHSISMRSLSESTKNSNSSILKPRMSTEDMGSAIAPSPSSVSPMRRGRPDKQGRASNPNRQSGSGLDLHSGQAQQTSRLSAAGSFWDDWTPPQQSPASLSNAFSVPPPPSLTDYSSHPPKVHHASFSTNRNLSGLSPGREVSFEDPLFSGHSTYGTPTLNLQRSLSASPTFLPTSTDMTPRQPFVLMQEKLMSQRNNGPTLRDHHPSQPPSPSSQDPFSHPRDSFLPFSVPTAATPLVPLPRPSDPPFQLLPFSTLDVNSKKERTLKDPFEDPS